MAPDNNQSLAYRLDFVERVFKNRPETEALLAPEREIGLLTPHDYDAAVRFFPGFHRHYSTIGTALGGCSAYAAKRPAWSGKRTATALVLGAFAGRTLGTAMSAFSHFKFVQTIEEPAKFSQALENVRRRTSRSQPSPTDDSQENIDAFAHAAPPSGDREALPGTTSPPQTAWDRIRTANAKGAQQSSWDAIRQRHEKAQMQRPPPSTPSPAHVDDRAQEQAKFDAMMERERNFKPNN